jgi:hypothetical protein
VALGVDGTDMSCLRFMRFLSSACTMQHTQRGTAQIRWRHLVAVHPVAVHPASFASQASFNEQIKHIIGKLHAVFVQPQQQQDKSLCGMIEHQMIFARPFDHIPDFDRPAIACGHDLGAIGRKCHRVDKAAVRVDLLAQQLQVACQRSQQASVLAKEK